MLRVGVRVLKPFRAAPPKLERWEDVTAECHFDEAIKHIVHNGMKVTGRDSIHGYRLVKVDFGVRGNVGFRVERRVG